METIENNLETADVTKDNLNFATPPSNPIQSNSIYPAEAKKTDCTSCSVSKMGSAPQYIYAIGQIQPRFPSVGIEKEFLQAISRETTKGMSDADVMEKILSEPQYRYLARKMCWVFSVQGLETYLLQPMNPSDFEMLLDALRSAPKLGDINVVIGVLGPIAPPSFCNGLQIPMVGFNQIYSFDVDSLIKSIPKPEKITDKVFGPIARELFTRIMQMTDNAGQDDDHRVLNYLAVRYHGIYATAAEYYSKDFSLSGVEVFQSALSRTRNILEVVFTFSNRSTDVSEKQYCRVDITEEFPFLVSKMQTYINR